MRSIMLNVCFHNKKYSLKLTNLKKKKSLTLTRVEFPFLTTRVKWHNTRNKNKNKAIQKKGRNIFVTTTRLLIN